MSVEVRARLQQGAMLRHSLAKRPTSVPLFAFRSPASRPGNSQRLFHPLTPRPAMCLPPCGLQDSCCERLTELALNDAEVAGSLLRQALRPCIDACGPWEPARLRDSAAAFQRVGAAGAEMRSRLVCGSLLALVCQAHCFVPPSLGLLAGRRHLGSAPFCCRAAGPKGGPGCGGDHQGLAGDDV